MATQTGQFPFTGRIGNVIGYKRNGVHFIRSMPDKVHQTTATRLAARNFGLASTKGSLIRRALAPYFSVRNDSSHVNRFNKTLIQSGIQGLKGYQFNQHTSVSKFFSKAPELSEDNILRIPAQQLPYLPKTTSLELTLLAVKLDFITRRVTGTVSQVINIDPNQSFTGLELNITVKGKGTLVVALQIRTFLEDDLYSNDRRFMAADIIAVEQTVAPKVAQQSNRKHSKKLAKRWHPYPGATLVSQLPMGSRILAGSRKTVDGSPLAITNTLSPEANE